MHVRILVDDDQRALELAHVLGVDPEVGLQRDLDVHTLGHVDERSARPHGGVQRGELVVARLGSPMPKYSRKSLVLLQRGVGVEEQHTLLLEVLADRVVDDLRLVLRGDTGDEALLLSLGDAEPVVGVLDVLGKLLPGRAPASRSTGRST